MSGIKIATAEWVDRLNHRQLCEYCGDIPSADLETAYYARLRPQPTVELTHH